MMESKPESVRIFQIDNTQPKLYPVIILNVDVDDPEVSNPRPRVGNRSRFRNSLHPLQSINKEKCQDLLRATFASRQTSLIPDVTPSPTVIDDAVCHIVDLITRCARNSTIPLLPLPKTW
jgi:hypothetical protein